MICVVTESQQVIIDQETVCIWPVFGALRCAEAGPSLADWTSDTPYYTMVFCLESLVVVQRIISTVDIPRCVWVSLRKSKLWCQLFSGAQFSLFCPLV